MRSAPFRAAAEAKDFEAAQDIFREDVTFRSPVVHRPYEGREALMVLLRAIVVALEDFRYVEHIESGDTAMLVFEARVGDRELQGVDILHFDEEGRVRELIVMLRPMSGLHAAAARMKDLLEAAGAI